VEEKREGKGRAIDPPPKWAGYGPAAPVIKSFLERINGRSPPHHLLQNVRKSYQ